jgi:hypothetical protein
MFHLPGDSRATVFGPNAGKWQAWSKPPNTTMISMLCMGSGGTGLDGATSYSGDPPTPTATGGTGGASGPINRLLIPAMFLPDTLYVLVGTGGGISYVAIYPSTTLQNLVLTSGGAATTTAAIAASDSMLWGNLGVWTAIAGTTSATWGAGGMPTTAGRVGYALADGTSTGSAPGITAGGIYKGNLKEGYWYKPLIVTGGGNGGSLEIGVAGVAYKGETGSGGGGGAAYCSLDGSAQASSVGAVGGSGLVIIGSW